MTLHVPRYVPLTKAASMLNTSMSSLNRMIQSGKIKAVEIAGEIAVSENSLMSNMKKEDLPEYKKFAHLAGQAIWVSEAARKYDVKLSVLHKWVHKNYIKIIGKEKNRILLDEQDVAYCAEIYSERRGQGKWVFNPDGTPYTLKTQEDETPA
jgi:predicted site-specific integrase-resolvase